jgi:hypothetical protein
MGIKSLARRAGPLNNQLSLGTLHSGQAEAYWALKPHRFKAARLVELQCSCRDLDWRTALLSTSAAVLGVL